MKESIIRHQKINPEKLLISKYFRKNMTWAEKCFWNMVKTNRFLGVHFRRQQVIHGFIADFYCNAKRVVVEIDGGIHESQKDYDLLREMLIKKHGVKIIRFSNEEAINNPDLVSEKLKKILLVE